MQFSISQRFVLIIWKNIIYDVNLGVVTTDSEETAFKDVDVALFVGAMPRKEGMERKDLLNANVKIFKSQGLALDKFAKKTVKVN